jgi:hypothetical protein
MVDLVDLVRAMKLIDDPLARKQSMILVAGLAAPAANPICATSAERARHIIDSAIRTIDGIALNLSKTDLSAEWELEHDRLAELNGLLSREEDLSERTFSPVAELTLAVMVRNWGFSNDGFPESGVGGRRESGEVMFPSFRREVVLSLAELSDPAYQSPDWFWQGRHDRFGSFVQVIHSLYDDFGSFSFPDENIDYVYLPGEPERVKALAAALDPYVALPGTDYRWVTTDPEWSRVVRLSAEALNAMIRNWGFPHEMTAPN